MYFGDGYMNVKVSADSESSDQAIDEDSSEKEKTVTVKLHLYGTNTQISMRACGLYTYQICKDGSLCEVDPVTKTV